MKTVLVKFTIIDQAKQLFTGEFYAITEERTPYPNNAAIRDLSNLYQVPAENVKDCIILAA